jgi:hypothetical protein
MENGVNVAQTCIAMGQVWDRKPESGSRPFRPQRPGCVAVGQGPEAEPHLRVSVPLASV